MRVQSKLLFAIILFSPLIVCCQKHIPKGETEKWILNKLNQYGQTYFYFFKDPNGSDTIIKIIYSDYSFRFNDTCLLIDFTETSGELLSHKRIEIPINNLIGLDNGISECPYLLFYAKGDYIVEKDIDKSKQEVTNSSFIGFNYTSEINIVKRLEKAFFNLKRYFKKPINPEPF